MPRKSNSGGDGTATPPRDIASLRLDEDVLGEIQMTSSLAQVTYVKPNRQVFIRCHPKLYATFKILEHGETRQSYLVAPGVHELEEDARAILLQAYVTRQGAVRLWGLKKPLVGGNTNSWIDSAFAAREVSLKTWIRITSNQSSAQYEWKLLSVNSPTMIPIPAIGPVVFCSDWDVSCSGWGDFSTGSWELCFLQAGTNRTQATQSKMKRCKRNLLISE